MTTGRYPQARLTKAKLTARHSLRWQHANSKIFQHAPITTIISRTHSPSLRSLPRNPGRERDPPPKQRDPGKVRFGTTIIHCWAWRWQWTGDVLGPIGRDQPILTPSGSNPFQKQNRPFSRRFVCCEIARPRGTRPHALLVGSVAGAWRGGDFGSALRKVSPLLLPQAVAWFVPRL